MSGLIAQWNVGEDLLEIAHVPAEDNDNPGEEGLAHQRERS
jgi:hypothetical protein